MLSYYIINLRLHQELSYEFGDNKIIANIESLLDRFHKIVILLQSHPAVFQSIDSMTAVRPTCIQVVGILILDSVGDISLATQ